MANMKTVSFGPGNADLQTSQVELQRRQMMIDALRRQAMEPLEVQQMGPVASKVSPWQGLAKLGQAYFANTAQKDVDERQAALSADYNERTQKNWRELFGVDHAQPGQNGDPARAKKVAQVLAAMNLNPELGTALAKNMLTDTDEMKNLASMGIDPKEAGRYKLAGMKKDGFMQLQPGTTSVDLATGSERFQPKVGEGINLSQQGASALPGYAAANAEIAGAQARATAAGQAGYDMVTINTPSGPVMMTKEQAAQMSGAQSQAPIEFNASNGVKLNFSNMSPQQVWDGISKSGDPSYIQAFQEYAQSQKGPGIALQSDAQKAEQVGRVNMNLSVEEKKLKDAQEKSTQATKLYEQIKAAIPMARQYLQDATGSGVGALADKAMGVVGMSTKGSEAAAQLETLAGWLTANVPRMEGPQSNVDVENYRVMAARVGDRSLPNAVRLKALDTVEQLQNKYADINKAVYGGGQSQIDALLKKYGGQ